MAEKIGLDFYKNIAKNAKDYLKENGYLALEIGYNQKESVQNILMENGYKNIYSKKDLSGNDRVVVARKMK
jgi:release factor glutamine methyltransferase